MALFNFHFDRPGPGVSPDAPRKKGPARFFEILGRDLMSFYLAGLLALVSALPFVFTAAPGNVTSGRRFCRVLSAVCCWPCRSLRCSIMTFRPV